MDTATLALTLQQCRKPVYCRIRAYMSNLAYTNDNEGRHHISQCLLTNPSQQELKYPDSI